MKTAAATIIILLAFNMISKSQVKIGFEVSFTEPQAHYAEIEMTISGLKKDHVDIRMPVWAPGSYLVREFSKNIEGLTASSNGKSIRTEKIRKNAWRIYSANANSIKVKYRIYAFEVSVRTSFVDDSHAFLSPTGIFMYPDGMLDLPSTVRIKPFKGWEKVSTGLEPVAGEPFTYTASNFDILYDSPIEVGNQDVFEFTAAGVKHEVAMVGGGNYDTEKLKKDMARIVEEATAMYGENPNKHYTFIVHNYQSGGGGLEHLNSTVLGATRNGYTNPKIYLGFLNLVAHEYYHLWNVKRLRPQALGPFDYENENYTTSLWVAEGFTAYYENKLMHRSGFLTTEETVQNLATAITGVVNTPGAKIQSVAEASYDAWIKYYRPNENSNNSTISYYNKGEVLGMFMDLEISNATKGTRNLDDVMKAMYDEYYKAKGRGYTDSEFKAMVEKLSGVDFTAFWEKYVNGTGPLDYEKYFGYAGINVKNITEGLNIPYLGTATKRTEAGFFVSAVSRNSAAWTDGINVNDELISVDDVPVDISVENMPVIMSKKPGESVMIRVRRDGLIRDFKVTLKANPNVKLEVTIDPKATNKQKAVLKGWLK
ncbi:M61 family metallopeptidase [Pedobacter deserti]|uniref:M61 family metallopeptidase n=1 Tax=Pedobacter deserti TaxID=2817382 RepID=UPI00210F0054|nr:PDZ domain-containing protein [Pedobacter sp. SYSU D00382]